MVKINGEWCDVAGQSIAAYLETNEYDCRRIAVERNGTIIPKSQYTQTILQDGDCVEIVRFVGGG